MNLQIIINIYIKIQDYLYKDYGIQIEPDNACLNKFTNYIYSNDQ